MSYNSTMAKRIIKKVWERKATENITQLLISIPKDRDIKKGDYVEVRKIKIIQPPYVKEDLK